MKLKIFALVLTLSALLSAESRAQLFPSGQDPARIKWNQIHTAGYKFIYPEGYDSLAIRYARVYERYRLPVSKTSGFVPAKVPVVLHPANASASYALSQLPSRIDMPVLPQGYYKFSCPVSEMATVNMSRRAAHLQFGSSYVLKPFTWFFGELFPYAITLLYPDVWILEGDAAVASTAIVRGGYGRYADFMNYYMAAFDAGDVRGYKWDRWALGSPEKYTPGLDAFGYLVLSGLRTMYDAPDYIGDYLTHIARRPYDFFVGSHICRKVTGESLNTAVFRKIIDYHREIYSMEVAARAPFTEAGRFRTSPSGKYADYSSSAVLDDGSVFSVRESLDQSSFLIKISASGNEERKISSFSDMSSRLAWSEPLQRLYWSELVNDWRWQQKQVNVLRYYDAVTGKTKSLTSTVNVFNPCLSPDGTKIAAIYGPEPDRTSVIILDAESGSGLDILPASGDGILFSECAWCGDKIYASGISDDGNWIFLAEYDSNDGKLEWIPVLGPVGCTIRNLGSRGSELVFSCDASGVFDLYQLCPSEEGNNVIKLTSTKYGAKDFVFDRRGEKLYYSRLDHLGYDIYVSGSDDLFRTVTCLDSLSESPVAEKLIKQENEASEGVAPVETDISEPSRYRKGANLFRLHSWTPVYCNFKNLEDFSGESLYDFLTLGATVLSQNTLGTAYGSAGYSWRPDPDGSGWKHGGHLSFTYAGWYPVIEYSMYINDRLQWNYDLAEDGSIIRDRSEAVSFACSVGISLPLSRHVGGMTWNFKPEIIWEIDNSRFDGQHNNRNTISGSFWLLKDKAAAEIFPRYGIGVETGIGMAYAGSPEESVIKLGDSWYMHTYGYVPGIWSGQGGKISLTMHATLNEGIYNPPAEILPRGLAGSIPRVLSNPSFASLLTFDYAIPVYLGDVNITPLIYLNRMIITPHFDYGYSASPRLHLFSAGASLTFGLGRLLLAFPMEIGIDYSYNFGTLSAIMGESGTPALRHTIQPVIKINL